MYHVNLVWWLALLMVNWLQARTLQLRLFLVAIFVVLTLLVFMQFSRFLITCTTISSTESPLFSTFKTLNPLVNLTVGDKCGGRVGIIRSVGIIKWRLRIVAHLRVNCFGFDDFRSALVSYFQVSMRIRHQFNWHSLELVNFVVLPLLFMWTFKISNARVYC